MKPATLLPTLFLTGLCACAGGSERPADLYDIDEAPQLGLVEELRLGSVDDPDEGFSRIGSVAVDQDQNLYVFEGQDSEIRVYDQAGTLRRTIGRRGEGPGEFEGFASIGVLGDTIWAVQILPDHITLFTREGSLISSHRVEALRIPAPECSGYVSPHAMLPDGTFSSWMNSIRCTPDDAENGLAHGDSIPVPRVRFAATGEVLDTVGWDPIPPPSMRTPPEIPQTDFVPLLNVGDSRYRVPSPPRPRTLRWEALPDGRIGTDVSIPSGPERATFRVARLDLSGDTVYSIDLAYTPVPVTEADLDSMAAESARSGPGVFRGGVPEEVGSDPGQVRRATAAIRAEMDFPPFRSPVARSRAMEDGSLWILRDLPADEPEWVIVDPAGRLRGKVILPESAYPVWSDGQTLLVNEPDDFEVPWLVRYRIEG